jgi:UDP-N-acetylglucosamine 2-epimerase (non-hydrolysing)
MEAGNRCFDQRVPEEINRKVLDHLSDINLVLTEHARNYLITEGVRPDTIIKTGSHMREVLDFYLPKIKRSEVLVSSNLEKGRYFIVSAHREENVDSDKALQNFLETLDALAQSYNLPVVVSTHPRTNKRLAALKGFKSDARVRFAKPFGFCDYIHLQLNAHCVISDSGTITEEASLLNLPAVMIRDAHERLEGMDSGSLIMAGLKKDRVLDAVKIITEQHYGENYVPMPIHDYENVWVSKQVLRVVVSYTEFINQRVWHKS